VVEGAPNPTNYEMVREAQVIVLARAVARARSADEERHPWGTTIRFEVEEVLKGDFRPSSVTLDGSLQFAGRGSEDDFSQARPGAYAGSCLAYDYRLNHSYVLFLGWNDLNDEWSVTGMAFSRANEEVDPDSPWLKTVRHYLRVAALRDYDKEKAALRELRSEAAAGTQPRALVADIDRHFQTPSVAKSPADLIDLYKQGKTDEARRSALFGLAATAPPAAKDLMREVMLKQPSTDTLCTLGQYFSKVLDPEILAPLSKNWDHLQLNTWCRQELLRALSKAAGPQNAPIMAELLRKAADSDQATVLAFWFASPGNDPRPAIDILHSRLEDTPGDFTRYQDALAVLGDPAVVPWAEERLSNDSKIVGGPRFARVLAFSPLPAADAATRKIIESGDAKRIEWLRMAFTDPFFANGNPRRWDRLDDILRSQSTNASFLATLKTDFFYLRRNSTGEDKAAANRLFERTREAIAALPSRQK